MTLLSILILMFIVVISTKGTGQFFDKLRKFMTKVPAYKIVGLYCAIGLAAFIFLQIGPIERVEKQGEQQEQLVKHEESEAILALLYEGKVDDIADSLVRATKTVATNKDELYLRTNDNSVRGVISYRDDTDSNEIIMTVYHVTTIFNGYDVTGYMNPVNLDIVDNLLYFTTQQKHLNVLQVYGEMLTIKQEDVKGYYALNGQHVVHVSVPRHKKVMIEDEDFIITPS